MPELLLELLSEEIPARMQRRAADDLGRLLASELDEAGLAHGAVQVHVTPRRLVAVADDVAARQEDLREERRGPRVGAPDKAVQGFLQSCGVSRAQCEERETGKGVFLFAVVERSGQPAVAILPDLAGAVVSGMNWPKSMRWSGIRWVRPLSQVMCVFDGSPVPVNLPAAPDPPDGAGVPSGGNETVGHRFLAPARFPVKGFADYRAKLERAFVVLDRERRKTMIREQIDRLVDGAGLVPRDDEALLDEVAGLVEWPVSLLGRIDEGFLDVPDEVLITSMRRHQKYFCLLDKAGSLAPFFVVVANIETADGGAVVVAGNERVLRARLSDARFFWDQDRRSTLESRVERLSDSVFHGQLGTMRMKAARLERLARLVSGHVPDCGEGDAGRAGLLAKADLVTEMVLEFPELQGAMGRHYALHDGESAAVADALRDHHSPAGPGDACPDAPVSVAVAVADRLDTLAGFFAIGETPTGSRDPFALRRAALGLIRLILENRLSIPFRELCEFVVAEAKGEGLSGEGEDPYTMAVSKTGWIDELFRFVAERLKVHLRDQGVRHDHVAAAFAAAGGEDLLDLVSRVRALEGFLGSEDGSDLLKAHRRAGNIVAIEERKDGVSHDGDVDGTRLRLPEELGLASELDTASRSADAAMAEGGYVEAMRAMAKLRGPIDGFFDGVTVNAEDPELRVNRLRLLSRFCRTMDRIGDLSLIEG